MRKLQIVVLIVVLTFMWLTVLVILVSSFLGSPLVKNPIMALVWIAATVLSTRLVVDKDDRDTK